MRWFEHRHIADMVLSARADARHPGDVALQPIIDLLERIAAIFRARPSREPERKSRSSLPPSG